MQRPRIASRNEWTYNFLDLTPLGRQEEDGIMRWLRHHDKYSESSSKEVV
jgi:predicted dithiol-disulfide oxidoreductase (DUF899 family)